MENLIRTYKKDEIIFSEGAFEMCMYHLTEGTVGIYANYGKPDEKLLTTLSAADGATFGEMGLLESMPRSASAVALDDVQAGVITGETFDSYFRGKPEEVMAIMQNMSKRMRGLSEDYLDACRAVAETVDSEKNGKAKSGWFKTRIKKFLEDYEETARLTELYGVDISHGSNMFFW